MHSAKFLALIAALSLAGCATNHSDPFPVCPEIVQYDPAFQWRAADEIDALPAGSALGVLIEDYLHLRDRIRACESVN